MLGEAPKARDALSPFLDLPLRNAAGSPSVMVACAWVGVVTVRRGLSHLLGGVLAAAFALLSLTALIDGLGASSPMMLSLMRRYAPSEVTGLPEAEYPGMAAMIAGYLAGKQAEFQYTWVDAEGQLVEAFRDNEQHHMADCRGLFILCRRVLIASLAGFCLALALTWALRAGRDAAGGFLIGGGVVLLAVLALAVWGLMDFDGLFILFHQLSFDNGLWLMNPAENLLIRLMPIQFFIHEAAVLAVSWMGVMALAMAAAGALRRSRGKEPM